MATILKPSKKNLKERLMGETRPPPHCRQVVISSCQESPHTAIFSLLVSSNSRAMAQERCWSWVQTLYQNKVFFNCETFSLRYPYGFSLQLHKQSFSFLHAHLELCTRSIFPSSASCHATVKSCHQQVAANYLWQQAILRCVMNSCFLIEWGQITEPTLAKRTNTIVQNAK